MGTSHVCSGVQAKGSKSGPRRLMSCLRPWTNWASGGGVRRRDCRPSDGALSEARTRGQSRGRPPWPPPGRSPVGALSGKRDLHNSLVVDLFRSGVLYSARWTTSSGRPGGVTRSPARGATRGHRAGSRSAGRHAAARAVTATCGSAAASGAARASGTRRRTSAALRSPAGRTAGRADS
jgi:hypothetical protein